MHLGTPSIDQSAFVAPSAEIHGDVRIGERAVIMFGAVLRAELEHIAVGAESNVQDNVIFHTDAGLPVILGRRVTVGHAAVVHGAAIGDRCLVGIGAMALNGSVMGEGAWLAAGAVLAEGRSVDPWTIAAGVPAKPIRKLTDAERQRADSGVESYLQIAQLYLDR